MVEEAGEFVDAEVVRTKKKITFTLIIIALSLLYYFLLIELEQSLATTFFFPLASSTLMFLLFKTVGTFGDMRLLLSAAVKKLKNVKLLVHWLRGNMALGPCSSVG